VDGGETNHGAEADTAAEAPDHVQHPELAAAGRSSAQLERDRLHLESLRTSGRNRQRLSGRRAGRTRQAPDLLGAANQVLPAIGIVRLCLELGQQEVQRGQIQDGLVMNDVIALADWDVACSGATLWLNVHASIEIHEVERAR
jgi:hypothetical protein